MPLSAHAVAAELRARQPGLGTLKLHKLLYYCQGHHLATFGEPLFSETVSAFDNGPVVGQLWYAERYSESAEVGSHQDEAALNTVGYVLSRYGALSGRDLIHLTHNESPWQLADSVRTPGTSVRIEHSWMREYFSTSSVEEDDVVLDGSAVREWLRDAEARAETPATRDDPDQLAARAATMRLRHSVPE